MLYVHDLQKSFGTHKVVSGVSFDLVRGQVLGFLGPNGAGKTTTMRMLTGFLQPDNGDITVCDTDATKDPTLAQSYIGYLPEGAPLYGDMTPFEYLSFIADIRNMSKAEFKIALERTLHDTLLQDTLNRPIDTLSKGFKRRVGLAGALLSDPEILILDEPTDGLDPNQKHHVRKLIKKLSQKKGIIISTHILEEVEAICTDTVIINHGKIISYATPKQLLAQSDYYNAVSVIIESDSAEVATNLFENHAHVREVKLLGKMPKWTKMIIYPHKGHYILGDISGIIHENGWHVAGVQPEAGRLEEVFRRLTAKIPS